MPSAPSRRSLLAGSAAALSTPLLTNSSAAAATADATTRTVTPGADVAAQQGWSMLRGRKVGVVSNPTGVLRSTAHVVDSMAAQKELNIVGVFGPEHG
ncbi:DUF1343 domain-containing protein, partial [Streptomyces sp. A7024]